jgi:hypothetical protein
MMPFPLSGLARPIAQLMILFLALGLLSCEKECSNQLYDFTFHYVDAKTGQPLITNGKNGYVADSVRVFEVESGSLNELGYTHRRKDASKGYVFGPFNLQGRKERMMIIQLKAGERDTLVINNQSTPPKSRCGFYRYYTTINYNNQPLTAVSNDTTSSVSLQLRK